MLRQKSRLLLLALAGLALAQPVASAQGQPPPGKDDANVTGEDNEFGVIEMPFQQPMNGQELLLEARAVLKTTYAHEDATYFLFAVTTEKHPALYAKVESVKTVAGDALTTYDRQSKAGLEQWFVDVKDMPPAGTEIVIRFTVGSTQKGFYEVGAMVMPFNYRWEEIKMGDGETAKLYAFTQLGVNQETKAGGGMKFRPPLGGDSGFGTPAAPLLLAVAAVAAAALALRRRQA